MTLSFLFDKNSLVYNGFAEKKFRYLAD